MERRIDFSRDRLMLCGACNHRWRVDLSWLDRWDQGKETCPSCGTTCEHQDAARVTVDPGDPALDDRVERYYWYHTSMQPDWPTEDFDPAAELSLDTRMRMGGDLHVANWAARQRAKALHVGTYEAAIHNMLRRIHDQASHGSQFHLYRVHLRSSVVARKDWIIDPSDFVGDVPLAQVCPPGVDVARYLNYHEDAGGLSLALGRDAIDCVQQVPVPLAGHWNDEWVGDAVAALLGASSTIPRATGRTSRFKPPASPRAVLGQELVAGKAEQLPIHLQGKFASAAAFAEGEDPLSWARRASGLVKLVDEPRRVLAALDEAEYRQVHPRPR